MVQLDIDASMTALSAGLPMLFDATTPIDSAAVMS
jgi:hypothetical protein